MLAPSMTTIHPFTTIRRERMLPLPGEVVAQRGDEVSPVQVVARAARPRGFTILDAAAMLDVPPEEVPGYLLVNEGTALQRKKPLLEKPGFFGARRFESPVNGILYRVKRGRVILQHTPQMIELRAMLHGRVVATRPRYGVVVEAQGALIQAAWGSGQEGYGTVRVVVDDPGAALEEAHIGVNARGSILVAGRVESAAVLERAGDSSVRGIVVGFIPGRLATALARYRFPVIVTEGFGTGKGMATPVFELLQKTDGREGSVLSGESSGRPELIVPATDAEQEPGAPGEEQRLRRGQRVRLLRAPHAGKVGEIVSVHNQSQATAPGYRLPGVRVALEDGQLVFVPALNVELIR